MKKIFAGTPHTKFIAAALTWTIAIANSAGAAQLQEARVTQVVNDVKLLLEQGAPRTAVVSDLVRRGNAVRTGSQSRSELTFADLTITRLGANTIFSFKEGTREMNLIDGAILFQVPKGSGGATIRTVGVTAAITGTTGIAEFHPATTTHSQVSKWLCLEGTFHLYLANGQSVELGPGKIVTADGKSFSKVVTFDIAKLVSTSLFFTGYDQPLASMNLIMLESENQLAGSLLAATTNPLDPTRIVNVTSQAIVAEETPPPSVSPTVSPTVPPPPPTPSKFGTPSVISSPNPYLITNGTVITTDPSIVTNSVTDYGKIYRGQTDDGSFSLWAFGSTSAFDTALRIDDVFFADPSHLPIAVFKFESLSLTGDPTIDTTNGVTKLGLIGVDGITSGPPGGTLTFTGLDLLLLATVNGSINLTSNVSFQDLHELVMYARGAASDLTINSPISNVGILGLVAQHSIHLTNSGTMSVGKLDAVTGGDLVLQIGGSLLLNGRVRLDAIILPAASVAGGINLTLDVTDDYTNTSTTQFSHLAITNRDSIGGDAGIALRATNISAANDLDVQIVNQGGGRIGQNALMNVGASNDINIMGAATFQIVNSGGRIGGNATIDVSAANFSIGDAVEGTIDNISGGSIGGNANINFNLTGDLTRDGDADFLIDNQGSASLTGGTIGSDAVINLSARNISTDGALVAATDNTDGGQIGGNAKINVSASTMSAGSGGITFFINNQNSGTSLAGGTIIGDATIDLTASNIFTSGGGDMDFLIFNHDGHGGTAGGMIGGNAKINIAAAGISSAGYIHILLLNSRFADSTAGGSIGGDATINLAAANISWTDDLQTTISNTAANISGSAIINFSASRDLNTPSFRDTVFRIYNNGGGSIGSDAMINVSAANVSLGGPLPVEILNQGGNIGGSASVGLTATNLSVSSLQAEIDNSSDGTIGGNATINMNVSGTAAVTNDATVAIYGSDGAKSAAINFEGGSYNAGGTFLSSIDGNGTITFNNASAHADVLKAGVFGANGVLNIGGGTLSADTTLKLYAPGSNGQLNFISNVTLGGNSLKILAANSITIFNNVVVTIGGSKPADVYTGFKGEIPNANYTGFGGNDSTTGTFGGAGANDPQPIEKAPPFGTTNHVASSTKPRGGGRAPNTTINVRSSDELLALLNDVHPGRDGRIRIPDSKRATHGTNASRFNTAAAVNAHHRPMDTPTASIPAIRRLPQ